MPGDYAWVTTHLGDHMGMTTHLGDHIGVTMPERLHLHDYAWVTKTL